MINMSKGIRFIVLIVILVIVMVAGIFYFFLSNNKKNTIDWENESDVFNITIPADFDQTKLDRIEEKKKNSLDLYRTNKGDEWTWITIGNLYEFAHEYERAVLVYKKVVEMDKNNISALINLANIYDKQFSDYAEAVKYYKIIEDAGLLRTNTQLYNDFAMLYYLKMDNPAAAEDIYLRGLMEMENSADLIANMIAFYKYENNPDKAKEYARKLVELYPDVEMYKKQYSEFLR